MLIKRIKGNIIISLPLWQISYDALDQPVGEIGAWVGIIDGDEQGLAPIEDLGYKGSFQYGGILIYTNYEEDRFIDLCDELEIPFFKYPICFKCERVIYGSFTFDKDMNDVHEICK